MLRATTNLIVGRNLQLDKHQMKQGFMYVYNKGYTGLEPVFMNRLWMATFMPMIAAEPTFGDNRKQIREWASYASKNAFAGLIDIKKVNDPANPHFVARIPLATFNRNDTVLAYSMYQRWFNGSFVEESHFVSRDALEAELRNSESTTEAYVRSVNAAEVIRNMQLDPRGASNLTQCLLGLRLVAQNNLAVVYADFRISPAEAQQLTTTEWLSIRNIDLYPLLMQWVAGQFGFSDPAPTAAFPVSSIAATLPKVHPGDARVNSRGLSIDAKGSPMWLPQELDNTARYEDRFTQAGAREDGSFVLLDLAKISALEDPTKAVTKLPPNIPVLIDWINKKYAYTQSNGMLKIQDLSRYKAADPAHIQNLLTRLHPTKRQITAIAAIAEAAGVPATVQFQADELAAISNIDSITAAKFCDGPVAIAEYWDLMHPYAMTHVTSERPLVMDDLQHFGDVIFRPLARYFKVAHKACVESMDVINARYSVAGVSTSLGVLTLLTYAGNMEMELAAKAIKAAAASQGLDPAWVPPPIPMLGYEGKVIGMIPHQLKVRNLLKDSPDFAILPVQAGGGKSVLTITDILYEILANRNAPYLILCPAHLVAQYAKEIVYFTGSKLNVIPVNTNSILRNGFKRLTKMIETAPRNTVIVADYDVLRARSQRVCYGTASVTIFPVIEFLRQFKFGYAMLDESHYVKNDTARSRACMNLIADIPKKRLASGTMAHDSPSDLALQIAMLDPTLFGSRDEFNSEYGHDVRGERVVKWKLGAQQKIMEKIKSRVVVAGAMRKEWAALLPTAEEEFLGVDLTPNQYVVYNAIFNEGIERMREDAIRNVTLQKFFAARLTKTLSGENDAADENEGDDLVAMLGFYLARVEQFITAPAADEMGARLLKGDDLVSPKVLKIIERIRLHLEQDLPGKILVFTNYVASAEAIFNALPADLQCQALLYTAAEKAEVGSAFEKDPKFKIMIGVENSMNTGLNLQFVSRLIRTETVWNPGTLEQGNSRVNRPNLKQTEARSRIFYDWVIANGTFDVTKIARLISKIIAVAKFENTDNPAFEDIEDVEIIKLDEQSILDMNTWDTLMPYGQAYAQYRQVRNAEYELYRKEHGKIVLQTLAVAPTPDDARIMEEVPYAPGLELFGADDMGLIRVDEFLQMDAAPEDESESEDDKEEAEEELTPRQKAKARAAALLVGKPVHTDFGDGEIKNVRMKGRRLNVRLNSGGLIRASMAASFVAKDGSKLTNIREALLSCIGDIPRHPRIDIPSPLLRPDNLTERRAAKDAKIKEAKANARMRKRKKISVELNLVVSNGYLGLSYAGGLDAKSAMQSLGFRPNPAHVRTRIKSAATLRELFDAWADKGYTLESKMRERKIPAAFTDLYRMLKEDSLSGYTFSKRNKLRNFFREEAKPSASKKEFKPYPMIEAGKAYVVMQTRGQAAVKGAIKVKVDGVKWTKRPDTLVYYGLDLAQTGQKIKEILAMGIDIANIQDLKKQFRKLRRAKLRKGE